MATDLRFVRWSLLLVVALSASFQVSHAQNSIVNEDRSDTDRKYFVTPYAFYSGTLEFAGAATFTARGLWQPQLYSQNTLIGSSNGSFFLLSSINDLRILDRLFVKSNIRAGQFGLVKVYSGVDESGELAGKNDSDVENYREKEGTDVFVSMDLRYLLPLGSAKQEPVTEIVLRDGRIIQGRTGAVGWHPVSSGRTFLELKPFFRVRDLEDASAEIKEKEETSTNGLRFGTTYENVDFSENPSTGSIYSATYNRDFGWGESDTEWDSMEFEYSRFLTVAGGGTGSRGVLALNVWTSQVLSWDEFDESADGSKRYRRPPSFLGSTLGGNERFRGYDVFRFSDRSALYYGMEYRHTPDWRPVRFKILANQVDISWFQFVAFAEAGRVAPDWQLSTLHEDMKWDAGIGVRPWVNDVLVRVDLGLSSEGQFITMTVNQPF